VDPVTQQAMDIDINTDSNQFDWLHVNIPEISMFSSVEDLIQTSVQKVTPPACMLSFTCNLIYSFFCCINTSIHIFCQFLIEFSNFIFKFVARIRTPWSVTLVR